MTISLHEPSFDAADEKAVLETLRSTWVSTGGPQIEEFERRFAEVVGANYAVSTCNGTVALQLMLEVLKRREGISGPFDVIVPDLSFIATANAVVHAGGHPIFVDASAGSMNLGCDAVRNTILLGYKRQGGRWVSKDGARPLLAVLPAHIMGWLGEVDFIQDWCREHDITMLEDAAESLGTYDAADRHAGTRGLAAAFSFNGNKILTTGGGGMIVTNDKPFAERAKHLLTTAKVDGLRYLHDEVGYNFRLVNILGALGLSQLIKLPAALREKQRILARYEESLRHQTLFVYREQGCQSNNWLINLVFHSTDDRERALQALLANKIQARPLWTPFHMQPSLKAFSQVNLDWPNAESMWRRCLSMPSSPQLTDEQIDHICSIVVTAIA